VSEGRKAWPYVPGIRGRLVMSMLVAGLLAIVGLGPFLRSMVMPVLVNNEGERLLAAAMVAAASVPAEREDLWMARLRKAWPEVAVFILDLKPENGGEGPSLSEASRRNGTSPDRVIQASISGHLLTKIDPEDTTLVTKSEAAGWEALVRVPDHVAGTKVLGLRVEDATARGSPLWRLILLYGALVMVLSLTGGLVVAFLTITRPLTGTASAAAALLREQPEGHGNSDLARIDSALRENAAIHREDRRLLERQEWEIQRMRNDLKGAQGQLIRAEKLASVGQLAAGVAHEIGNPTGIILGMSDILRQGGSTPGEVREYADAIHKATVRVDGIIRDMLTFARPTRDESAFAGVRQTVESTVKLLEAHKLFKNVAVTTDFQPAELMVEIRPSQLQQVLFNLLLNAAHAMDGSGTVEISVSTEGRRIGISIRDHGRGIPEKDLKRIFDPFFTTKQPGEGTGLGLAMSSQIVEVYGGEIDVESVEGKGSTFTVRLWQTES